LDLLNIYILGKYSATPQFARAVIDMTLDGKLAPSSLRRLGANAVVAVQGS
jgi:hypothetical protein